MSLQGYKTINAFTQMPSVAQIFSYCILGMQIGVFYAAIQPNFNQQSALITFHVLFGVSLTFQIISALMCSVIDPSDSIVMNMGSNDEQLKKKTMIQILQKNEHLFCPSCNQCVKSMSRHCRTCRRCAQNFDHHCMWINNCIGGKNYKHFVFMVVSTFLNIVVFIASVLFLTAEGRYHYFIPSFTVSWVAAVILLILGIAIGNLIILHIYLAYQGMTTYQLITKDKQSELKEAKIQKVKQQNKKKPINRTYTSQEVNYAGQLNQKTNQNINVEEFQNKQNRLEFQCHDFAYNSQGTKNLSNQQNVCQVKVEPKKGVNLLKEGQTHQLIRQTAFFYDENTQNELEVNIHNNGLKFSKIQNYLKTNRSVKLLVGAQQKVSQLQKLSTSLYIQKIKSVNKNEKQTNK